ncbi:hypothetical protein GmRootV118_17360 [Variovorax sp. V118]
MKTGEPQFGQLSGTGSGFLTRAVALRDGFHGVMGARAVVMTGLPRRRRHSAGIRGQQRLPTLNKPTHSVRPSHRS